MVRLQSDIIKLDRSITESIDGDSVRRALATAMVIFAGETGASVVGEGIETQAELVAIRRAEISRGQGFGLARPRLPLAPLDYRPIPDLDLASEVAMTQPEIPRLVRRGEC